MRGRRFNRRNILKAGVPVIGSNVLNFEAPSLSEGVSVTFESQITDGTYVVVSELTTDIDLILNIRNLDHENLSKVDVEAGTSFEDRKIELDDPISETQTLTADLFKNGSGIGGDGAQIIVGDGDEKPIEGFEPVLVDATPDAGFNYPYLLYAPLTFESQQTRPILAETTNSGEVTDDFEPHLNWAKKLINGQTGILRNIADKLSAPVVVPVLPRPRSDPVDGTHYIHALDNSTMNISEGKLERVDLQVLNMIEDARERLADKEYPVADGVMLNGFSSSGNFVERFTALHPEEVISVTAGGLNGMPILPIAEANGHELDYHVGIADKEELTGEPFDKEAFSNVNQFLYSGEFDTHDTIAYSDAFTEHELRRTALSVYGKHVVEERFPYSKSVYEEAGVDAVFRLFDGLGHTARPIVDEVVEFHQRTLAGDDIETLRTELGGNIPKLGAHIEYDTKEPDVGDEIVFEGIHSAVWEHTLVDYEWEFDHGDAVSGDTVTHVFNSPGGHNVSLTVTDDTGRTHTTVEQVVVGDSDSENTPEVSITLEDQDSDGSTITVADVTTEKPVTLLVRDNADARIVGGPAFFEEGESVKNVSINLTDPTPGTHEYIAHLSERSFREGRGITDDTAQITIDNSVTDGFGPKLIEADSDAGFNYPYYLYAPTRFAGDSSKPILVEPNNSSSPSDDFEYHRKNAERRVQRGVGRSVADNLTAPFIVPVFPRPRHEPVEWFHAIQMLDDTTMEIEDGPLERVDLQLLSMVADAQQRLADQGYPVSEGIMLNGFSATGNFVDRFTALHPNEIISVTAGGLNGMSILPLEEARTGESTTQTLNYHVGVANIEELIGEPFDLEAFQAVNRFLYMGDVDMSDTIPFEGAWTDEDLKQTALDVYGRHMQAERFPTCRAADERMDTSGVFKMFEEAPHSPLPAEPSIIEFHERSLTDEDIEEIRSDLGGGVPNRNASVEYAPRVASVGDQVAFHATTTDIPGREAVSFEWEFNNITRTGDKITHTFETPGTHTLTLTVTDETGSTHQAREYITVRGEPADEADLNAAFQYTPEEPTADKEITFNASDSYPNSVIDSYEWSVNGNETPEMSGQIATYTFEDAGEYEVSLTITGTEESDTFSKMISVLTKEGGPPPVPGQEASPQDMTGNGLYEDINGDGDFTLQDIQLLLQNRNTTSVQKYAEFYNFSGSNPDEVTLEDVRTLYQMLSDH